MSEPTSALTFEDLILEVARETGMGYYGSDGTEALQIPTNTHDLAECKRIVNNGIRQFFADAPPTGWRFTRPVADFVVWPSVASGTATVTGDADSSATTLTASTDVFYPSMEGHDIVIDGVGTFEITSYVSATSVVVDGDATSASADDFTITADGNYTLPSGFSGAFNSNITAAPGTNEGFILQWSSEGNIRRLRENESLTTGFPQLVAVRPRTNRRRWEMVVWPTPHEVVTLNFSYDLHFDSLDDEADKPPIPFSHDAAVKAACLSTAELEVHDGPGRHTALYNKLLQQSYAIDGRSAPKKLGYMWNPPRNRMTRFDFREFYERPNVTPS